MDTAGHLVSMVVAYGIANAPTALLANHMQTALAAAVAREGVVCSIFNVLNIGFVAGIFV